jgi:putative inorganic carbon (HCO3(-)) transporter
MIQERAARWLAVVVVAVLPLVSWPGLAQPFSAPKRWLLMGAGVAIGALTWRRAVAFDERSRTAVAVRATPFVWLASWVLPALFAQVVSFDALLTGIAAGLWGLALFASRTRPRDLLTAAAVGGTAVAAIAVAQWAGYDPFSLFGWQPDIEGASVRMRVYATLGNPNFVAASLAATAPLTAAATTLSPQPSRRVVTAAALVLQLLAIIATGSRAGALGLVAAGVVWTATRRRSELIIVAIACVVGGTAIWLSEGRPLGDTIRGRLHVWRLIAPHALEHPWVGLGPGGIETHYVEWEQRIGVHQHADNDYLEALVERGVPGLAAVLFVLFAPIVGSWRHAAGLHNAAMISGASGALAAIAAVALVDEPLARPTELMLLWTAIAVCAAIPSHD